MPQGIGFLFAQSYLSNPCLGCGNYQSTSCVCALYRGVCLSVSFAHQWFPCDETFQTTASKSNAPRPEGS